MMSKKNLKGGWRFDFHWKWIVHAVGNITGAVVPYWASVKEKL